MRIVELKSQSTKIIYKPAQETLKVGDFISLTENDLTIIAQVYKILSSDAADDFNQADLIFVLTYRYDKIKQWQGELVSADAMVDKTPIELIENYISGNSINEPFLIGNSLSYDTSITFDFKNFQTPSFVGYENPEDNISILTSLSNTFNQLNKKIFVLDYKGNVELPSSKKILAGVQSKLPLNTKMIEKLSSKILDGISIESKVVLEDILLELSQYAEESNLGFIPISNLITTIDDFYKKTKIAPLILLKNKLSHYKKLNIFADTKQEVNSLYSTIKDYNVVIFDLSNIQFDWQNEFLINLIEPDSTRNKDFYIYLSIDNKNFDNSIMNYLLFKSGANGIKPIISANYRHLAFDSIFDFSKNTFLFKTYNALKKRSILSDILQTLPQGCFISIGKLTNSLILSLNLASPEITANEIQEEFNDVENNYYLKSDRDIVTEDSSNNPATQQPSISIKNPSEFINSSISPTPETTLESVSENEQFLEHSSNSNILQKNANNIIEDISAQDEQENLQEVNAVQSIDNEVPVNDEISSKQKDAIQVEADILPEVHTEEALIELDVPQVPIKPQADEIIEINMPEPQDDEILELVESQVQSDEDDILFEEVQSDNADLEDIDDLDFLNEPVEENTQDETDDDLLDLIEEDNEPSQPVKQELPVYEAKYEEPKNNIDINLQEGDLVKHNKYGVGTIKKITKHGEKILCHINFDNFGRRLLDPGISQLQKIN